MLGDAFGESPMIGFLLSRIASAIVVVIGVCCIVFALIHLIPGDPVEAMLGEHARAADREALRAALGLDRPIMTQLIDYLLGVAQADLGQSLHSGRPITAVLMERLPATIELAVAALVVAVGFALPLGMLAAMRSGSWWDWGANAFAVLGVAVPNFIAGPLLVLVFSVWLGWFPISGRDGISSLVLPALTLGSALAPILTRMVRSSLLEVMQEDFIRTARAKGLSRTRVVLVHALPNAMLPIVTIIGLQLGTLLGGAVITEMIFAWQGIGHLTIESIQRRDYPMLQGCMLVISVAYVGVNAITDGLYSVLDPRIRYYQEPI